LLDYAYVSEALKDKAEIFGETERHTVASNSGAA
jgi:hypothetical protein